MGDEIAAKQAQIDKLEEVSMKHADDVTDLLICGLGPENEG